MHILNIYDSLTNSLEVTLFLNEAVHIYFHSAKWFQVLLFNRSNSIEHYSEEGGGGGGPRVVMAKVLNCCLKVKASWESSRVCYYVFTFRLIPLGVVLIPILISAMSLKVSLFSYKNGFIIKWTTKVGRPLNKETNQTLFYSLHPVKRF